MPKKESPPSFQFYPRQYLSSQAVAAMHPTARGGYVHLLCHAWLSDRPGWLPDDDKLLSALSGLGERWQEHRETIARAWRIRKGWWVQVRMVESRRSQQRYFLAKSRSGKAGNKARWQQGDRSQRDVSRVANDRSSSSSSSAVEPRIVEAPREEKRRQRRKAESILSVTPEQVQAAALRFNLPLSTAQLIAERVTLEAPQRGYLNVPSAFLNWCKREADNPTQNGNGRSQEKTIPSMWDRPVDKFGRHV